jgi:tRNA pseudouridine38-40 synthase
LRYFIEFAYKGTKYHGWQMQPNAISVQEILTAALALILNTPINLVGAGRTDTGVHAKQMFAHFDYEHIIDNQYIIYKLNAYLPKDIAIINIHKVNSNAHARFDATARTYQYNINSTKNAFDSDDSYYFKQPLNIELMNKACLILKKYTDFECFSKTNTDVATFNCKIEEANWTVADTNIYFTITADRFLRNMVRSIVGTMIVIGLERISLDDFCSIIESKNRSNAGFSAPAHGLYLTAVKYNFL